MNFSFEERKGLGIAEQVISLIRSSVIGREKVFSGYLLSIHESNRKTLDDANIEINLKYHFEFGMVIILEMFGEDTRYGMQWEVTSIKARFFHEDLKLTYQGEKKTELQIPVRILHDKAFRNAFFQRKFKTLGLYKLVMDRDSKQRKSFLTEKQHMEELLAAAKIGDGVCFLDYGSPSYGRPIILTQEPYSKTNVYKITIAEIEHNLKSINILLHSPNPFAYDKKFGTPLEEDMYVVGNNGVKLTESMRKRFPHLWAKLSYGHPGTYGRGVTATDADLVKD